MRFIGMIGPSGNWICRLSSWLSIPLGVAAGMVLAGLGCSQSTNQPQPVLESYVHVRPSWSKDGKTVAFCATINNVFGIYQIDTSGANLHLLHAGDAIGVTWSPDSRWIAFSEGRNLYKLKANGDSLVQLTSSAQDIRPSWSPDGRKIAFVHDPDVWLLDVQTNKTSALFTLADFPTWLSGGAEIAVLVSSYATSGPSSFGLYATRSDTTASRLLYSFTSYSLCRFPSASPSRNEIVFVLTPSDDLAQIWKVDLTTNQVVLLVAGGDYPSCSPDGNRIVYTRTQQGDGALWIMSSDGTGSYRLTSP